MNYRGEIIVKFNNLSRQYERLKARIDANISVVIKETSFIGGTFVDQIEEKLASYVGRKHCITCGNGTDALQLAYIAYGIGYNDAVFCPAMTFVASVEPACALGAKAIFCDIDKDTYNLSPSSLKQRIEDVLQEGKYKPKAVVTVDFLGNPCDIEEIQDICKKYNLVLIEDAAQGMGATYKSKKCCSFGDIATTSFYPTKPLGCYGDGGAVFTDDDEIAYLIRSIKVHGKGKDKYDNIRIGINSRLDNLQAGILIPKLQVLDDEIDRRNKLAKVYSESFSDILKVPCVKTGNKSSYAQYIVWANSEEERDYIVSCMKDNDIPSLIYYPNPLHKMKAFECCNEEYKNAEIYAKNNFGIPFSPYLLEEEQKKVIDVVRNAVLKFRSMEK